MNLDLLYNECVYKNILSLRYRHLKGPCRLLSPSVFSIMSIARKLNLPVVISMWACRLIYHPKGYPKFRVKHEHRRFSLKTLGAGRKRMTQCPGLWSGLISSWSYGPCGANRASTSVLMHVVVGVYGSMRGRKRLKQTRRRHADRGHIKMAGAACGWAGVGIGGMGTSGYIQL